MAEFASAQRPKAARLSRVGQRTTASACCVGGRERDGQVRCKLVERDGQRLRHNTLTTKRRLAHPRAQHRRDLQARAERAAVPTRRREAVEVRIRRGVVGLPHVAKRRRHRREEPKRLDLLLPAQRTVQHRRATGLGRV